MIAKVDNLTEMQTKTKTWNYKERWRTTPHKTCWFRLYSLL